MRAAPRLRRRARPVATQPLADPEVCELCGGAIDGMHRHLLDLQRRRLMCTCRACSLLFDREAAGGDHYRLVPDRVRRIEDFRLDDDAWARLRIPVELAFFFRDGARGRVVAFYPSPAGATESLLELDGWSAIVDANPIVRELELDVEALLVNRTRHSSGAWLAPVDVCYELVGRIRTRWKGLAGGSEVWDEIARFFADLDARSVSVTRQERASE